MTSTRPRYTRIEHLANTLLIESAINGPAVSVERIIQDRGIALQMTSLGDVSGLVLRKGTEIVIGVNKNHSSNRRRFTMAHELGHAILHKGNEIHYDRDFRINLRSEESGLGVHVEEIEANFFAACLLMPRRFLDTDPEAALVDAENAESVAHVAKRYEVSAHAMSIRLGNIATRRY